MTKERGHWRPGFVVGFTAMAVVTLADAALQVPASSWTAYLLLALGVASAMGLACGLALALMSRSAFALQGALGIESKWWWFSGAAPPWVGAWIHALMTSAGLIALGQTLIAWRSQMTFANAFWAAAAASLIGLLWIAASASVGVLVFTKLRGKRILSSAPWKRIDPLGSASGALSTWLLLVWILVAVLWQLSDPFRIAFPLRLFVALSAALLIGLALGARLVRGAIKENRYHWTVRALIGCACLALCTALLVVDDSSALLAAQRSPVLRSGIALLQTATDVDRDGFTSMLGGSDCRPWDGDVHPLAKDIPNDGVDQNCTGFDYVPPPTRTWSDVAPSPWQPESTSILLVTIDTLRLDHLSVTGYPRETTPNLDSLARDQIWFDRYYSTGNGTTEVLPALASSAHYGQLPLGPRLRDHVRYPRILREEAVTLAEHFKANGFRTAQFAAMGYFPGWGIDQGFDHIQHLREGRQGDERAPELTARAMKWIGEVPAGQRYFVWIHYYEPHRPYHRHPEFASFGDRDVDRYDGELQYIDREIGRWRQWLATNSRGLSTALTVTSDHGELFGEFGMSGHGQVLLDALVRVPLLMRIPGAKAIRVPELASTIDLAPTLALLAGIQPSDTWHGESLIPAIMGEPTTGLQNRAVFLSDHTAEMFAVVQGWWKLAWYPKHNLFQLVNLQTDAPEQRDATGDNPEVAASLKRRLLEWHEWVRATSAGDP